MVERPTQRSTSRQVLIFSTFAMSQLFWQNWIISHGQSWRSSSTRSSFELHRSLTTFWQSVETTELITHKCCDQTLIMFTNTTVNFWIFRVTAAPRLAIKDAYSLWFCSLDDESPMETHIMVRFNLNLVPLAVQVKMKRDILSNQKHLDEILSTLGVCYARIRWRSKQ